MHVGEDRSDSAGVAGRFGRPGGRVEMFDKDLVYAFMGSKYLHRGPGELRLNPGWTKLGLAKLGLTPGHGSVPLALSYVGDVDKPEVIRANG